jgi:hypothetical protein
MYESFLRGHFASKNLMWMFQNVLGTSALGVGKTGTPWIMLLVTFLINYDCNCRPLLRLAGLTNISSNFVPFCQSFVPIPCAHDIPTDNLFSYVWQAWTAAFYILVYSPLIIIFPPRTYFFGLLSIPITRVFWYNNCTHVPCKPWRVVSTAEQCRSLALHTFISSDL